MSERINTRCPACGHQTLILGNDGLLVCSWLECREPAAINDLVETVLTLNRRPALVGNAASLGLTAKRTEALAEIAMERASQDAVWREGRANEQQYAFAAPHVLILEECVAKTRRVWYGEKNEGTLRDRFVKIAAVALRALEEINF